MAGTEMRDVPKKKKMMGMEGGEEKMRDETNHLEQKKRSFVLP